ncbi:6-phosphofructokinase [candidate division KSB1 bacterium]
MRRKPIRRVGVLTGGGDCPGLNAVIRAVVKTGYNDYNIKIVGIADGFEGLMAPGKARELTPPDTSGILPQGGTILGTTNRGNPFEYKIKQDGEIVQEDRSDTVVENIELLELDALIVIGGDGSLKIANRFFLEKNIPVVGIPKTIDNDLQATDMTFGFKTAVQTATDAIDKLHTTAESHHRIMIVEVMGRYVGWIALESGLAGGADVILIPEIPYNVQKIVQKIKRRSAHNSKFSIVVVAEGAFPVGGTYSVSSSAASQLGAERLGGAGNVLAREISEIIDMDTRVMVLGHLQRGGTPVAFDRILATRYGTAAVDLVMHKKFGDMVCLRTPDITSVSITEAVSRFKAVDPGGQVVKTAEQIGVNLGR